MSQVTHDHPMWQILNVEQEQACAISEHDRIFEIDASFEQHGVWAGVAALTELAYKAFKQRGAEDILDQHNYLLYMVLPMERADIPWRYANLTDTAEPAEKTRNFPLDRAFRICHGIVTLLSQWKEVEGAGQKWAIYVRNSAHSQYLATRVLIDIARRLGCQAQLNVYLDAQGPNFLQHEAAKWVQFKQAPVAAAKEREYLPAALEKVTQSGQIVPWECAYSRILAGQTERGEKLAAALTAVRALCMHNHYGYYYESNCFLPLVLEHFDEIVGEDEELRWNYTGALFNAYVTTGQEVKAHEALLKYALPYLTRPELKAKMHYMLSISHVRFLKPSSLPLGEEHIAEAVRCANLAKGNIPDTEYEFFRVFIDNGLALLRVRQGRKEEALALCIEGFKSLTDSVGTGIHKLHRSVLLYNAAQVYVMLGQDETALHLYEEAMEMDPHYSDYYNEVGNILLRQGRFAEALGRYQSAIKYSSPFAEVYFNMGVCHTHLEELEQALNCFAYSLELNPGQVDLHVMRGELLEMLGREDEALVAYGTALKMDQNLIPPRVNRAVIQFGRGDLASALDDINFAIQREPANMAHYENRAAIYQALNQTELQEQDLAVVEQLQA